MPHTEQIPGTFIDRSKEVGENHPLYSIIGPAHIGDVPVIGMLISTHDSLPFYVAFYVKDAGNGTLGGYAPICGNTINPMTETPFEKTDNTPEDPHSLYNVEKIKKDIEQHTRKERS